MRNFKHYLMTLMAVITATFAYGQHWFDGGEIQSRQKFTYGRVEIKAKVAAGSSIVNGLFFFKPDSWMNSRRWAEIDWEVLGRNTKKAQYTVHHGCVEDNCGRHHSKGWDTPELSENLSKIYAVYIMEWSKNKIRWVIKNQNNRDILFDKTVALNTSNFPNLVKEDLQKPQKIMIDLWAWSSRWWPGNLPDGLTFPRMMYIDWVRYYPATDAENHRFATQPSFTDYFNDGGTIEKKWTKSTHKAPGDSRYTIYRKANVIHKHGKAILRLDRVNTTASRTASLVGQEGTNTWSLSKDASQGGFKIGLPTSSTWSKFALLDLQGFEIEVKKASTKQVLLGHQLPRGVYIIKAHKYDGSYDIIKAFID